MAATLTMPKLEMSMGEGTLAEWMVERGTHVNKGDVIYTLETDNAAREIEAPASVTLMINVADGEVYPVGTEIGEIV